MKKLERERKRIDRTMKLFGQACKRLENVSKAALFSTDEIFCSKIWHKINHWDLSVRERERERERIGRDRRMINLINYLDSRIVGQEHLVSS